MTISGRPLRATAALLGSLVLLGSALVAPATAAPRSSAGSDAAFCNAGDLTIRYRPTDAGAGHRYGRIVLRNHTDQPCRTHGYGGISYADADGRQVGASATRTPGRAPTVLLRPGQRVVSVVDETVAANYPKDTCRPRAVASFKVYPPEGEYAQLIPHRTTGCAGTAVKLIAHQPYRRP